MKRLIISCIFAFAIIGMANAIVVQKVMLKNGSVLYGYIQQQDGTGKLVFHTDSAMISINGSDVKMEQYNNGTCNIVFLPDSVLPPEESRGFEYYLKDRRTKVSNVKLLEKGAKVSYWDKSPNNYTITWDEIISIQSPRRCKTALSGINRICKMKNGQTFEGQYAGETEDLQKLFLSDGLVQSFKIDEVVKYTYNGINPNQDIFAQSELLDVVKTKNASEIKGVIIEQNYESSKDADNFFIIKTGDQASSKVSVSDILVVRKEENPKYSPKFDVILKEGEVMVNRKPATLVRINEKSDFLQLDSITGAVKVQKDSDGSTRIVVEYRSNDSNNAEVYQLVKVKEQTIKKDVNYGFTYKDLVNTTIRASKTETSVNRTTRAEYSVNDKGIYALYDAKGKKAIPLKVE